jgi:hypothetical protein
MDAPTNFELLLRNSIEKQQGSEYCFDTLYLILCDMKKSGYSKKDVVECLEKLRDMYRGSDKEDIVLDLLDIPARFCQPKLYLW